MLKPLITVVAMAIPLLFSCRRTGLCKDEEFGLGKDAYNSASLRTDGFYYSSFVDIPITSTADTPVVRSTILILYRNGVVNFPGGTDSAKMNEYVSGYLSQQQDCRYCWGLFSIAGSDIQLERRPPTQIACSPIERMTARILNDSTFVLSRKIYTRKGKIERDDNRVETYHFRKFNNKPDSTNNVIK